MSTTAPAHPNARRALKPVHAGLIRSAITIVAAFGLIAFVWWSAWEVGNTNNASTGAIVAVGFIGFGLLVGLVGTLIGIASGNKYRWMGWTGFGLFIALIVLTIILIASSGASLGVIGQGWHGIIIGALLLVVAAPNFLFNKR